VVGRELRPNLVVFPFLIVFVNRRAQGGVMFVCNSFLNSRQLAPRNMEIKRSAPAAIERLRLLEDVSTSIMIAQSVADD
jgi:hypothetical protein